MHEYTLYWTPYFHINFNYLDHISWLWEYQRWKLYLILSGQNLNLIFFYMSNKLLFMSIWYVPKGGNKKNQFGKYSVFFLFSARDFLSWFFKCLPPQFWHAKLEEFQYERDDEASVVKQLFFLWRRTVLAAHTTNPNPKLLHRLALLDSFKIK